MTTDPRELLAEAPGSPEDGPEPGARYARSTTWSHQVPHALHETVTISTTRTYDAPRPGGSTRRLALLGIAGLAAVAGGITGVAATSNHAPAPHAPVPVHHVAAPAFAGHPLVTLGGSGLRYSAPFLVTRRPLTVRYSYRCTSGSHPFTLALTASRSDASTFANTAGTGASRITTVYPRGTGTRYRIVADSVCPYQVSVYQR
jgi:hypothetical protein